MMDQSDCMYIKEDDARRGASHTTNTRFTNGIVWTPRVPQNGAPFVDTLRVRGKKRGEYEHFPVSFGDAQIKVNFETLVLFRGDGITGTDPQVEYDLGFVPSRYVSSLSRSVACMALERFVPNHPRVSTDASLMFALLEEAQTLVRIARYHRFRWVALMHRSIMSPEKQEMVFELRFESARRFVLRGVELSSREVWSQDGALITLVDMTRS